MYNVLVESVSTIRDWGIECIICAMYVSKREQRDESQTHKAHFHNCERDCCFQAEPSVSDLTHQLYCASTAALPLIIASFSVFFFLFLF